MSNETNTNNLFDFATRELSQDAYLCWLINWINFKENTKLYNVARKFLNYIVKQKELNIEDYIIKPHRQYKKIDVYIELLNKDNRKLEYAIIIEDKKFTSERKDQLKDYKEKIKKITKLPDDRIITGYYKPYDELYSINPGTIHIKREDMLNEILNEDIDNNIYMDYKKYLERIENNCNNIKSFKLCDWENHKELYYKFASEYNKKITNSNLKMYINQNGWYLDWYKINPPKRYNGYIDKIYLSATVNDLRIRAYLKENVQYNEKLRKQLEKEIKEISTKLQPQSYYNRKGLKSLYLARFKLKSNANYDDLIEGMKQLEDILKKLK